MSKSKGELLRDACVFAEMQVRSSELPLDMAIWNKAAEFYDKATATDLPADVLAYVTEVEARANAATDGKEWQVSGLLVRTVQGFYFVAETRERKDAEFIANARADVPKLIAIVREQVTKNDAPDGENLYNGCLCGEISPKDKPCLTCATRLSQWDSIVAERDALRERVANTRDELDSALVTIGKFLMFPHPSELISENNTLQERITKLEALGPWIEANRLAQLQWADESKARGDVNHREQRLVFEARADAFKQCGYELNNRAGKDLRKETKES